MQTCAEASGVVRLVLVKESTVKASLLKSTEQHYSSPAISASKQLTMADLAAT